MANSPRSLKFAFTLVEVVIATTVVATMMVCMLAIVDISAEIWRRADQRITLSSEGQEAVRNITDLLQSAIAIDLPPSSPATSSICFTIPVATGTQYLGGYYTGKLKLNLRGGPAFQNSIRYDVVSFSSGGPGLITFTSNPTLPSHVDPQIYNGVLTNSLCASFTITRNTPTSLELYVRLESPEAGETYSSDNATPSWESKTTIFTPAAE